MGLLLAVFQRLSLRRRMDSAQAELMKIGEQQRKLTNNIAAVQRAMNRTQSIFDAGYGAQQRYHTSLYSQEMTNILSQGWEPQNLNARVQAAQTVYQSNIESVKQMQALQKAVTTEADEYTLDALKRQDTEYSQEKERLEVQLKLITAEYESVGKLIDQEAKESAPKFGLS